MKIYEHLPDSPRKRMMAESYRDGEQLRLSSEQKVGNCELCGAKNVIVTASGFYVAFACDACLSE